MLRKLKLLILVSVIPVLLITVVLCYLNFADLGGWRDSVADLISKSLGREMVINGLFEPEIGLTTSLTAGNITLANTDWGSQATMLSIDHLELELNLLSLLFRPIRIERLDVDGVRVLLETDLEGRSNWEFETGDQDAGDSGPLKLALESIDLTDIEVISRSASIDQEVVLGVTRLGIRGDETGMLDLSLDGHLNHADLSMVGRLGPLAALLQEQALQFDFTGNLGVIEFSSDGQITDLKTLGGAELRVEAHGTDLAAFGNIFGLSDLERGPFRIDLGAKPANAGTEFDLDISAGGMIAEIAGTVDSLIEPGVLDLTVEASGPDATTVSVFTGIEGLPAEEFTISGHVRWEGFPISFDTVEVRVGDNSLSADGMLGEPPLMMDTDFTFSGGGPDISPLAALAGVKLPKDAFSVGGRLVRLEQGIAFENIEFHIGSNTLEIEGAVGDPPEYTDTALTINGKGPSLAYFQDLASIDLPAETYEIKAKLIQGDETITLEAVRARLGRNTLELNGQLSTEAGLAGTDLRLFARGPDASQLAMLAQFTSVPAEPWTVEGRVKVLTAGFLLDGLSATLGGLHVKATGQVQPTNPGTDLQIHIEDPDVGHIASIAGFFDLPAKPVRLDGRVRIQAQGYRIDGLAGAIGDIVCEADGRIGLIPDFNGSELLIAVRGPRLSALSAFVDQPGLPEAPFKVSGTVRRVDNGFKLDGVSAKLAENILSVDGLVIPAAGLAGTDLEFSIAGPNLGNAAQLASTWGDLPELPAETFSLSGRVVIDESGYQVENIETALADSTTQLAGRIGSPPSYSGTDLTINSYGPEASLFTAITGVTMPVAPFRLAGRIERLDSTVHFHSFQAQLGQHRIHVDGNLGFPPNFIGTGLEINAEGPNLSLIGELLGLEHLPDQPYILDGLFDGTMERFSANSLVAKVGPNDLNGSFSIDITGKPEIQAELISRHLDLKHLLERQEKEDGPTDDAMEFPATRRQEFLFPDKKIDLDFLHRVDADVTVRVKELILPAISLHDVDVDLRLESGRLEIEHLTATGEAQGSVAGNLVLEPDEEQFQLSTQLRIFQVRPNLGDSTINLADQPPIDVEIELEARGATPHDLAGSADGWIQVVMGQGELDSSMADLLAADILRELLRALNPYAVKDKATQLRCAVLDVNMEDGVARLEPLAIQTDKMTILGKGRIDFTTESLDLDWVTKPRKGIGLSASMITNPYIKLRGTLSNPSIQFKELQAVASTGVAVATFGLSLVAKGMLDRATADRDVCQDALKTIDAQSDRDPNQ